MRNLITLFIAIVCAQGCGSGTEGERDVAGERAPSNRSARLTEELRIDGRDHTLVPFAQPSDAAIAIAEDGTVAIAQPLEMRIRFFSPDGDSTSSVGRIGEGPGEFLNVGRIGWLGDSLWVYDQRLSRVSIFTPQLKFARTIGVRSQLEPSARDAGKIPPAAFSLLVGILPGDTPIWNAIPYWETIPEDFGGRNYFATADATGVVRQVLMRIPADERMVTAAGASTINSLGNAPVHAISSDSELLGLSYVEMEGSQYILTVRVVDSRGEAVFERRFPIETIPLPAAVRDSAMDARASRMQNQQLLRAVEAHLDATKIYPPLREMIIGRDKTVWIGLTERNGAHPYMALSPDGESLGLVRLPIKSRLADAEKGRVWSIERDDFDVESLVEYRVDW